MTVVLFLLLYTFLLYPILLLGVGAYRSRAEDHEVPETDELPSVDLLIAAKNEENCIEAKIKNSLALDYPKGKLTIHVLANGCTDRTVEAVRNYSKHGVVAHEYDDVGKTEAQNLAVADSSADIIAFSDANTLYDEDALLHLVAPFADDTVGAVGGRHFYESGERATDATEGYFWNTFETMLKRAESDAGGMIGANGSIYAVRRSEYIPLPADVISDFIEPTLISATGKRTVYAEKAVARERAESSVQEELDRKQRIVRRSFTSLMKYPQLLSPARSGRLAWMLWSKKLLRWFAPLIALLAVVLASVRILTKHEKPFDFIVLGSTSLFGFAAMLGRGLGAEKPVKGFRRPIILQC